MHGVFGNVVRQRLIQKDRNCTKVWCDLFSVSAWAQGDLSLFTSAAAEINLNSRVLSKEKLSFRKSDFICVFLAGFHEFGESLAMRRELARGGGDCSCAREQR